MRGEGRYEQDEWSLPSNSLLDNRGWHCSGSDRFGVFCVCATGSNRPAGHLGPSRTAAGCAKWASPACSGRRAERASAGSDTGCCSTPTPASRECPRPASTGAANPRPTKSASRAAVAVGAMGTGRPPSGCAERPSSTAAARSAGPCAVFPECEPAAVPEPAAVLAALRPGYAFPGDTSAG